MAAEAAEALFVPCLFIVEDATFRKRFPTLGTTLGVQILIAFGAVELVILWDKSTGSNSLFAHCALEAFLVPIGAVVLKARRT